MSTTNTKRISFKTAQDLKQAFDSGTKLIIKNRKHGRDLEVHEVTVMDDVRFTVRAGAGAPWRDFNLDGSHRGYAGELHIVSTPALRPGVDILKSLSAGETLYCPKTREVVDGVVHHPVEGFLVFLWKTDENGRRVQSADPNKVVRVSDNYRTDGTHRHDPARDLVKGEVPTVKKTYVTVVGRNNKFGTIGTVTYQVNGPKPVPKVGDRVEQGELYSAIGAMPGTVIHVCTFEA